MRAGGQGRSAPARTRPSHVHLAPRPPRPTPVQRRRSLGRPSPVAPARAPPACGPVGVVGGAAVFGVRRTRASEWRGRETAGAPPPGLALSQRRAGGRARRPWRGRAGGGGRQESAILLLLRRRARAGPPARGAAPLAAHFGRARPLLSSLPCAGTSPGARGVRLAFVSSRGWRAPISRFPPSLATARTPFPASKSAQRHGRLSPLRVSWSPLGLASGTVSGSRLWSCSRRCLGQAPGSVLSPNNNSGIAWCFLFP